MEPTPKQMRAVIPILKGHVIDRSDRGFTIQFGGFRVVIEANMTALDLRDGDILTAYTEVLLKPPTASN